MFYHSTNNLFSRSLRTGPRETMKRAQRQGTRGGRGAPPTSFPRSSWQKRSKYSKVKFSNWCYTGFLYMANENLELSGRLSNFTNPFIPPCDDQVSDSDDLFWFYQHASCYSVIAGKLSAKPRGRYRRHIWIQYGPYIKILMFLIYLHVLFTPSGGVKNPKVRSNREKTLRNFLSLHFWH